MKRYSIHHGSMGYVHAREDTLAEAVEIVRFGDPTRMIGPIHPDALDGVRIDERDQRHPYRVVRSMSFAEALAEVEGLGEGSDRRGDVDAGSDAGGSEAPVRSAPLAETSDAYWCGRLYQALCDLVALIEAGHASQSAADHAKAELRRYDNEAGFVPVGATYIGVVSDDRVLRPGERVVNGIVYYSDAWL